MFRRSRSNRSLRNRFVVDDNSSEERNRLGPEWDRHAGMTVKEGGYKGYLID